MNKKLAQKLYDWYIESIQMIQCIDNITTISDICSDRQVDAGICWCACKQFDADRQIENDEWIKSIIATNSIWWTKPPMFCDTKEEILEALHYRADWLKEYIDNN